MLSSERIRVTLQELDTHWTIDDLIAAHDLLDLFEDAAEQNRRDAELRNRNRQLRR